MPLYIATTLITLNPENYGFTKEELNFEPEYQYETVPITEAVSIKSLAKCADLTVQELRMLNSELVSICTPPVGSSYKLKLPPGKKENFISTYAALTDDEKRPWTMHEVKKGETLATIASQYGVSSQEIASLNQMSGYKTKLKRGTSIRVPMESTLSPAPGLVASNDQKSDPRKIPLLRKQSRYRLLSMPVHWRLPRSKRPSVQPRSRQPSVRLPRSKLKSPPAMQSLQLTALRQLPILFVPENPSIVFPSATECA